MTGILGITSRGGPLISVGIFRPKFVVPLLINRFFALIREFGRETNRGKSHSYIVINMPTRELLAGETKSSFV